MHDSSLEVQKYVTTTEFMQKEEWGAFMSQFLAQHQKIRELRAAILWDPQLCNLEQHIGQGLGNSGFAEEKAVVKSYFRIYVNSFPYQVWHWAPDIVAYPSVVTLISPYLTVIFGEDIDQ